MTRDKQFETSVELHLAFHWVCPECGIDNWNRGVAPELLPEEKAQARAELGIEVWEEGSLMMRPEVVSCSQCKAKFDTEEPDYENDIEDQGFEY